MRAVRSSETSNKYQHTAQKNPKYDHNLNMYVMVELGLHSKRKIQGV